MSFAWTRNYYAITETPFPTVFCFESKKSRDSAVLDFGLKKISCKEADHLWDKYLNKVSDIRYKKLKAKYLLYDGEYLNEELFVKEMLDDNRIY